MYVAAGKSPTQELMWSWAQKNKRVGDLLKVLDEMGHARATSLFQSQGNILIFRANSGCDVPFMIMYHGDCTLCLNGCYSNCTQ